MGMTIDDKVLIEAFQAGDEFAFVSLYNHFKGPVYSYCTKMLGDKQGAQDVLKDTFLRIYENRNRLMKTDSFKAWLFTIARNQCLNQLRRSKRLSSFSTDNVENIPVLGTPARDIEKSEQIRIVNEFIGQLKPDYREVIILREYQNLSYEEIAAITRSTLSAVKSRLFKARKKLVGYLHPVFNTEEAPRKATSSSFTTDYKN